MSSRSVNAFEKRGINFFKKLKSKKKLESKQAEKIPRGQGFQEGRDVVK